MGNLKDSPRKWHLSWGGEDKRESAGCVMGWRQHSTIEENQPEAPVAAA